MSLIGRYINQLLPVGSITIIQHDGKTDTFGPGGGKHVTVRLHDRRAGFDIFRNPRLKFGELYMDGRATVEDGTILDLLQLVVGAKPWEQGSRKALGKGKSGKFRQLFRRNDVRKSRTNVAHHYDIGNDLYELFLDDDLQYSCAYFTDPANSLEQAQADKKAHIAAKLDLKPGQRVLDIGCGWGGMALYLHQVAGVDVLGITLSEEQIRIARERAAAAGVSDHVKFELLDYRLIDNQRFDRIVSVGMFEHVGAAHYDEFFYKCRELLTDDGAMLLHTIGKLGGAGTPDPFTDKWVFPGYHIPSLAQMCTSSEKSKLIVSDVESLRVHYAYTLRHWLERASKARAKIEALYDARFFRMWEFYLAGGIVMFESGSACNYQVQYIRDRRALPLTRDYMFETERKYRALGATAAGAASDGGTKKVAASAA